MISPVYFHLWIIYQLEHLEKNQHKDLLKKEKTKTLSTKNNKVLGSIKEAYFWNCMAAIEGSVVVHTVPALPAMLEYIYHVLACTPSHPQLDWF